MPLMYFIQTVKTFIGDSEVNNWPLSVQYTLCQNETYKSCCCKLTSKKPSFV